MTIEQDKPLESAIRQQLAQEAAKVLLEFPENSIKQIILFGSTARGDARPDSDIDLCVTFENRLSDRDVFFLGAKLTDLLHERGFKTGIHVPMQLDLSFLRGTYLDEGAEVPQLLKGYVGDMKKEGVVLYPPPKSENKPDNT